MTPITLWTRVRRGVLLLSLALPMGPLAAQQVLPTTPPGWEAFRRYAESAGQDWSAVEARLRAAQMLGTAPAAPGDSLWRRAAQAGLGPAWPALTVIARDTLVDSTRRQGSDPRSLPSTALPIFGASLFGEGWDPDQLTTSWPADDSYLLGPGDELALSMSGDIDMTHQVTITREGDVIVPRLGAIRGAGRTIGLVRRDLQARVAGTYGASGRTTLTITLVRARPIAVMVTGAVRRPGLVVIPGTGEVLHAILAAGGLDSTASLRTISVIRPDGTPARPWDAYALLLRGAVEPVRLQAGDIVRVPPRQPLVALTGAVAQPVRVEVRPGETIDDLLGAAGGTVAGRFSGLVTRLTQGAQGYRATTLAAAAFASTPLQPGDSLFFGTNLPDSALAPVVHVAGAVWAPGGLAWRTDLRVTEALQQAGGLRPDALAERILVTRRDPRGVEQQWRATWDARAQRAVPDLVLTPGDRVEVFSAAAFHVQLPVRIEGPVRQPGVYAFRDGMSVRDLILTAGGLLPDASPDTVEVLRNRRGQDPTVLGVPERVGLADDEVILEAGDHVTVLQHPGWAPPAAVAVLGEVGSPGVYALARRAERLQDVLTRAGGLRTTAYVAGLRFRRAGVGDINLNLAAVLANPDHRDNIQLEDGDTITVPTYSPVVRVRGQVQQPTAVAYVPGQSLDYYVNAAGGAALTGDRGRAFVQQANGAIQSRKNRLLFRDRVPVPQPGATVIVPERVVGERTNWGGLIGSVTGLLGSIITLVAISR